MYIVLCIGTEIQVPYEDVEYQELTSDYAMEVEMAVGRQGASGRSRPGAISDFDASLYAVLPVDLVGTLIIVKDPSNYIGLKPP